MIDQLFWSIFIFVTSFLLHASFPRKTRVAISISLLHSVLSWTLSKLTYVAYQKTLTYVILCYLIPESLSYAHPRIHIFFRHFCSGTSSINWRFARLTAVPFPVAILYTFVTSTSEKKRSSFFPTSIPQRTFKIKWWVNFTSPPYKKNDQSLRTKYIVRDDWFSTSSTLARIFTFFPQIFHPNQHPPSWLVFLLAFQSLLQKNIIFIFYFFFSFFPPDFLSNQTK